MWKRAAGLSWVPSWFGSRQCPHRRQRCSAFSVGRSPTVSNRTRRSSPATGTSTTAINVKDSAHWGFGGGLRQRAVRDSLHVSAADVRARDSTEHVDVEIGDMRHEHLSSVPRLQLRRARRTRCGRTCSSASRDAFQQRRVHRTRRSPRDAEPDTVSRSWGAGVRHLSGRTSAACRRQWTPTYIKTDSEGWW